MGIGFILGIIAVAIIYITIIYIRTKDSSERGERTLIAFLWTLLVFIIYISIYGLFYYE